MYMCICIYIYISFFLSIYLPIYLSVYLYVSIANSMAYAIWACQSGQWGQDVDSASVFPKSLLVLSSFFFTIKIVGLHIDFLEIFRCNLRNALHAHYYIFYSPKIFLCKGVLSRDFEYVLFTYWYSEIFVCVCNPKILMVFSLHWFLICFSLSLSLSLYLSLSLFFISLFLSIYLLSLSLLIYIYIYMLVG